MGAWRRGIATAVVVLGLLTGCGSSDSPTPTAPPTPIPVPHGVQKVAVAWVYYDLVPTEGEPLLQVTQGTGSVDFDAHTGTMNLSADPVEPNWEDGPVRLGVSMTGGDYLPSSLLGTPYPLYPLPYFEDLSHEWDIQTGLREREYEEVPSDTGRRWTSHDADTGNSIDGPYRETRTLDVAPDGTWTHTVVRLDEYHLLVKQVILHPDRQAAPPVAEVEALLVADEDYLAATSG